MQDGGAYILRFNLEVEHHKRCRLGICHEEKSARRIEHDMIKDIAIRWRSKLNLLTKDRLLLFVNKPDGQLGIVSAASDQYSPIIVESDCPRLVSGPLNGHQ